jgi:hypothetical protein
LGFLEYGNISQAELVYSRTIYSIRLLTGIRYKRLQAGCGLLEYKNSSQPEMLHSRSLYSRRLLTGILYKQLRTGVFLDIEIPAKPRFYIPEAYIPDGSLLESCTNGSRMWSSGIWKFHHSSDFIFQKPIFQMAPCWDLPQGNLSNTAIKALIQLPIITIHPSNSGAAATQGFRIPPKQPRQICNALATAT